MPTETLAVKRLGPYGFQTASDDSWINFSNKFVGDKASIVPGGTYAFDTYIAQSGKKYVNKLITNMTGDSPVAIPEPKKVAKPVYKAKAAPSYEGRDFTAEALGKTECSLLASLMGNMLKNPADKDEVKALVEEMALWVCRRGK